MQASEPGSDPDGAPDKPLDAPRAASVEELSALSTHLLQTIESERTQLAKELHDELGGLITAAKMDMAWLRAHIGGTLDAAGVEKFRSVLQMLDQAMTLKRRVVEALRPSLLDHFGLPVALRSHFEEACAGAGIEFIASLPDEMPDLQPAAQLTLFRVAQEALANLLARGNAKHVELVIEPEGEGYVMTVGDDAMAMNDAQQRALIGIRHRVLGAGGWLEATAVPGQGNRIRAYVPRFPAGSG